MSNRTTQRLVDQNVSRHLVTEQMAREERLSSEGIPVSPSERALAKFAPRSGFLALVAQALALLGL